jgi:serine protease Do
VTSGGPAARAGIRRGDVITSLGGTPVTSSARFRNRVAFLAPGTTIKLDVMRGKNARTVDIKLGNLRDDPAARTADSKDKDASAAASPPHGRLLDGIGIADLGPQARRKLSVPRSLAGVVVTAVAPGSAAERMGLAVGDVILELDRTKVPSVADFKRRVEAVGDAVVVLLYRGGTTLYLAARR